MVRPKSKILWGKKPKSFKSQHSRAKCVIHIIYGSIQVVGWVVVLSCLGCLIYKKHTNKSLWLIGGCRLRGSCRCLFEKTDGEWWKVDWKQATHCCKGRCGCCKGIVEVQNWWQRWWWLKTGNVLILHSNSESTWYLIKRTNYWNDGKGKKFQKKHTS